MRLDFNVLWVEDQPNNVTDQRERISHGVRKEGFRLQVQFATSVTDATKLLSEDIYGDHIDLILMDYDLGAGMNGADGLREVRDIFPYKDLVFYSANATAKLTELATDRAVQGIFTAYRPELPTVVEGVFENLVKKVLDIDHSRGIVMGATSDVDALVLVALSNLFGICDDGQKADVFQNINKRLARKKEEFEDALTAIQSVKDLNELAKHYGVYTSDDRFRLLQKLMKQLSLHQDRRHSFEEYRSGVMPKRNDLAHTRVERDGFSRKLFDRNGNELTVENMRALRVELLEFQELLEEIFA